MALEKDSSHPSPKSIMFNKLEEAILLCVSEAVKGIPEPKKWFYFMWECVRELSKQFVSSKDKNYSPGFSQKLTEVINNGILNDKVLKAFAEHCAKTVVVEFQSDD